MSAVKADYRVVVHHEDGSYWAEVLELPGCFAAGDTEAELWESLTEAIGLYLSEGEAEVTVNIAQRETSEEAVDTRVLVCS